jgi:hypothetical protein|tara:strand:+ start:8455 stop:9183 length:729 start_codon:yes stop_codon:yes gene_type:complete
MTVAEMHFAVEQGLQKVGSNSFDTFLPEELDFSLNKMQERFIKQRFWNKSDPKQSGYYGTQKRIDDLRVLTVLDYSDDVSAMSVIVDHEDFDLPTDYMFLVNSRVKVYYDDCGRAKLGADVSSGEIEIEVDKYKKEVVLRIVEPDDAYNLLASPFAQSTHKSPMGIISDTFIKVFTNKRFLLKGVSLDYIREPSEISLSSNLDCELAEHTHQEIVDLTVKHLLEATEAPRYQTNSIEGSQSE